MRVAAAGVVLSLAAACGGTAQHDTLSAPPAHTGSPDAVYSPLPVAIATTGTVTASALPGGSARTKTDQVTPATQPPVQDASVAPRPSGSGGTLTVDDSSRGRTIRLAVGEHLRVVLRNGTWDAPVSSAETVVARRSSRGGYPSSQPAEATFTAVGRGRADVTAQSDAACFHSQPRCLMASRQWQVTVLVR